MRLQSDGKTRNGYLAFFQQELRDNRGKEHLNIIPVFTTYGIILIFINVPILKIQKQKKSQ